MTKTFTPEIGLSQKVYCIAETGTYPALIIPVAASFVPTMAGALVPVEQERKIPEDHKYNRSARSRYFLKRNASFTLPMYVRGAGTAGVAPDSGEIWGAMFTGTSTTATTVSIADSVTSFSATTPANLAEVAFVGWTNSAGTIEYRPITDITVSVVTVNPGFSGIPQVADNLLVSYYYVPKLQNTDSSISIHSKGTNSVQWVKGAVPQTLQIEFDGAAETLCTFAGPAADGGYVVQTQLTWPMKDNYGFSQAGPTGDPALIDGTHKIFKISARNPTTGVLDAAEDCTLAGTEATWLAVVTYLNATAIPALAGTTNKICVAVLIGTGGGDGMYIRNAVVGNASDVLLTAGSATSCDVILELGEANGGYELDADEIYVDEGGNCTVGSYLLVDLEALLVTAINTTTDIHTVTRAQGGTSAAVHDIDDDVYGYSPATDTYLDVQPIAGITEGIYGGTSSTAIKVVKMTVNIDETDRTMNNQFGKVTADYHVRTGQRVVTFSATLEVDNTNLLGWLATARNGTTTEIYVQAGNTAGSIFGLYMPTTDVDIFEYDQGQDSEVNTIEITGVALASAAAGGDEIAFFFG